MQLAGKNVLVVMPLFFGYEQEIRICLENQGAAVHLIYENINDIYLSYKAIYAYAKPLKKAATYQYYKKQLSKTEHNFDYVLVIRGFSMSEEVIQLIREKSTKNCRYILYLWDSIKNNPNPVSISHLFDAVYTFDIQDAKTYGWTYHPTFYIDRIADPAQEKDIDIVFICSMHSERYQILKELQKICNERKWKLHTHVYLNKLIYFKYKYVDKKPLFQKIDKSELCFRMLSLEETYSLYRRSKIIVDYTNPAQTGYTQRTFESMGNGAKLITSNSLVEELDFYNEKNMLVYEGTSITIPEQFVYEAYENPDATIYEKYSLTAWVNSIIR